MNVDIKLGEESAEEKKMAADSMAALKASVSDSDGNVINLNAFFMIAFFNSYDSQATRWGAMWSHYVSTENVVAGDDGFTPEQFTGFMTATCMSLCSFSFNMGGIAFSKNKAATMVLQAGKVKKVVEAVFGTAKAMKWDAIAKALATESDKASDNMDSMAGWRKTFCFSADGKTDMFALQTGEKAPVPKTDTKTDDKKDTKTDDKKDKVPETTE
jgi:hypothetical protein